MQNAHTKDMISTRRKFPAIQYSLLPTPPPLNQYMYMYVHVFIWSWTWRNLHFEIGYSGIHNNLFRHVHTQPHCNLVSSHTPPVRRKKGPILLGSCAMMHAKKSHAKLGSDWSAQLHSYSKVAFLPWASRDCARGMIWLAFGNFSVQSQGFGPSSPDPFPSIDREYRNWTALSDL